MWAAVDPLVSAPGILLVLLEFEVVELATQPVLAKFSPYRNVGDVDAPEKIKSWSPFVDRGIVEPPRVPTLQVFVVVPV
jgi:hypothetical protein